MLTARPCIPFVLLFATLLVSLVACQPSGDGEGSPEAASGERVENAELGVAVAALPAFFAVRSNSDAVIELVPADPAVEGELRIDASEAVDGGINLIAAIEDHKAEVAAREGGEYKGQREMGTHLGTAFYSRGHFVAESRAMEETKIFMIHPWGDRVLHLVYVYPAADDSASRLQDQLFEVLGEIEGLEAPAEAPVETPAASDPAASDPAADG